MVTIVIDNWTIVSVAIPLMIIAIAGLSLLVLNYRNELQWMTRACESNHKYYEEYRHKYFSMEQKYNQLKKQYEEED